VKTVPPTPDDEPLRLAALCRYAVLDTPPEPAFDELTRLAASVCDAPMALISFVDESRVWFKSRHGIELTGAPRANSFCVVALAGRELCIVEDATKDERFAGNPLVHGDPNARFYAGVPLVTAEGWALGALGVLDRVPRTLNPGQSEALRLLGRQVLSHLELRRKVAELSRSLEEHGEIEERLRTSEVFFQTLVETLPQNIIRKDAAGRFTFANRKFCESIGRPLGDILGRTDFDLFPRELAEKYHGDDQNVMASQRALDTVEAHETPSGQTLLVHVLKTPLYDAAGRVVGVQGIFWDVTERRRVEDELAKERDLLRALLDNIPDRIYFKDTASRFVRCSQSMAERLGVADPRQVVGKTDFDFHPPDQAQDYFNDEQRVLASRQPLINKLERQTDANGREIWASVTKVPILGRTGEVTGLIGLSRDVTQLKQTEQALRQAEEKYRTIYENSVEGIFQTTRDGHFISANPALARLYGYASPDELVAALTDIEHQLYVDPTRRDDFARLMREHGSVTGFESEIFRKDKSRIWISESARTVKDPEGNILYYEGIVEDITARRQTEAEREKVRQAALETAQTKAQFLANMSHEIRTPMNAITGMTGLLQDTRLSPEQRDYVDTIRASTEALLDIINHILDFSKLEAGKVALEVIDFDLRDTLEDTAEMLAERAHAKGLELICHLAPGLTTRLRGDPLRLRQVLANLLSNAIKFTERGQVLLEAKALEDSPGRALVRCEVTDTGIGIPPEAMARIFQEFTQADGSTTRKYGGTGLGLTISRQLVGMMQGRIGVTSEQGRGSTFWIETPFDKQPPAAAHASPARPLSPGRTLVVDDNATQLGLLVEQLRHWQIPVDSATDASRALQALQQASRDGQPYALAIVDHEMSGIDGLTLAQTIKSDPQFADLRLILLTNLLHRLDPTVMRATGIAACLVKPIRQARLRECLVDVSGPSGAVSAGPEPGDQAESSHYFSVRPKDVRVLIAEDNAVNQRVALKQLAKLGFAADAVANGLEVLSALQRVPYNIIIMDCQMPEMDGYEVTRRIRGSGRDSYIHLRSAPYIVALTANALPGDRERCFEAGMNDYLTKPLRLADLEGVLQRALLQIGPAAMAAPSDPAAEVLDRSILDGLRELREPDQPDPLAELIELFLRDARPRLGRMSAAAQAGDWPGLGANAHSLKGSANNLGARRLSSLCATLEKQGKANDGAQASATLAEVQSEFEKVELALKDELQR